MNGNAHINSSAVGAFNLITIYYTQNDIIIVHGHIGS